jgi:hypothetical protein
MNLKHATDRFSKWSFYLLQTAFTLAILLGVNHLQAQEYDEWAFGSGAGLNVNTNTLLSPTPTGNSSWMEVSYCDASGNLWFYTKGNTIYNYQTSSVCSSCLPGSNRRKVIVPKVGGPSNEFYIFTVPTVGSSSSNGLSYHVYNATTNSITSSVMLGFTPGTFGSYCQERLAAVPHSNGTDYWVVIKPKVTTVPGPTLPAGTTNSDLYAYKVSAAGVANSPVISNAGYTADINPQTNYLGQSKFSPDKQYFASAERKAFHLGYTHLYRFNSSTGKFNHMFALPTPASQSAYGVSFSPNSKVLYTMTNGSTGSWSDKIVQYDLSNLDCTPTAVPSSCVYNVSSGSATQKISELQLTPNGRILKSNNGSNTIDVINNPNAIGCGSIGFSANSITVGTGLNVSGMGLPNNIDGDKNNAAVQILTCSTSCSFASFSINGGASNITWNFGDGTSVSGNPDLGGTPPAWHTSGTYFRPTHQFPSAGGTFTVTASTSDYSVSTTVTIPPVTPVLVSSSNFPVCVGTNILATISVTNSAAFTSISWVDCSPAGLTPLASTTGSSMSFTTGSLIAGTYKVCVTGVLGNGCISTSEYSFDVTPSDWPKITNTTADRDKGTCTATDNNGDIYMGGEFDDETDFDGITISGNSNAIVNAYLTKYEQCDGVQWVAVSSSTKQVTRSSMDINESLGLIYVSGRCEDQTTFRSGLDAMGNYTCPSSITINGNGVYVAIYNYAGCLQNVHMVYDNSNFIQNSAHVAVARPWVSGTIQNRVYLSINVRPLSGSIERLHVVANRQIGMNLFSQWQQNLESKFNIEAADISAIGNTVGVTGKFWGGMYYYNPGFTVLGSNTSAAKSEAFVIGLRDQGSSSAYNPEFTARLNRNSMPNVFSEGTGIYFENQDQMYLSGNFDNTIKEPFNILNTHIPIYTSPGNTAGYIFRLNDNNATSNPDWFRTIWADYKMTAMDIITRFNQTYFVGNWEGPEFFIDNATIDNNPDKNKMYIYCIDSDGTITSPNTYLNYSQNGYQGGDFITPTRISYATENMYVSGLFRGEYKMINDISQNSSILSTPSTFNSMLWRYDAIGNNGQAFKTDNPNSVGSILDKSSQIEVYPNPARESFVINLLEFTDVEQYTITIYDVTGKAMYNTNFQSQSQFIDTQKWKSGLYMIMIHNENESYSKKIIIGSN